MLVTSGIDTQVCLWDRRQSGVITRLRGHTDEVLGVLIYLESDALIE